jgi:hypothetical protein
MRRPRSCDHRLAIKKNAALRVEMISSGNIFAVYYLERMLNDFQQLLVQGTHGTRYLRIGDNVLTVPGEAKTIKSIGASRRRAGQWKKGEGPVKISRFAIDGKAPHSDLYISAGHAIYVDGILIPAGNLVNGVTIVADDRPELLSLTLFHIELDTHEAILAEGLAVETFRLDNQLTHAFWFDNADEYVRLYDSPGEPPAPFAPILRYRSSRQELASHMRSAVAPVCDFRKPIEKVRDRIIDRLARAA